MPRHVVLIRGIGAGTHRSMPLREFAGRLSSAGAGDVCSVLSTGNFTVDGGWDAARLRKAAKETVESFGISNEVFVVRADCLAALVAANPFPDCAEARPSEYLAFFAHDPVAEAADLPRPPGAERLAVQDGVLLVDYAGRITESALPPARIERFLGVPLTFRNWNTVRRLAATDGISRSKARARDATPRSTDRGSLQRAGHPRSAGSRPKGP